MKIIISPAKKMKEELESLEPKDKPVFQYHAERLKDYLKGLKYGELKKLLNCNDSIAALNFERYQNMDLNKNVTPAILAYEGIQYQYMAPQIFEYAAFDYVQEHLRILSGFYGLLKPLDGIVPYRLEMQAKLKTPFCSNLYDFWKDCIYNALIEELDEEEINGEGSVNRVIIDLASEEYSKAVSKYLRPDVRMIACIFGEWINGKVKEKGVYVKMARGEMVRFMADHEVTDPEEIKTFNRLGYAFQEGLSDDRKYVFLKNYGQAEEGNA